MKILVDLKNLALYNGGIAHWIRPLIMNWIQSLNVSSQVISVFPASPDLKKIDIPVEEIVAIPWPIGLPRNLRHPFYDNWLFPKALKQIHPQFLFSPYHDLRIPKRSNLIFAVITVHDLCFIDVPQSYPFFIRQYYLWMMRLNIARAHHILTVSESTKQRLINQFALKEDVISVVPNALEEEFLNSEPSSSSIGGWRQLHQINGAKIALYAGGIEYRKNVERLISAFRVLWQQGYLISLCITGKLDFRWQHLFSEGEISSGKIKFLGYLSLSELRIAYSSVDCIVYPSLCEGFGRVCLEAMACGTPLACSNLAVFHEVAGDYPHYFDPTDVEKMAISIKSAAEQGRQEPFEDDRYRLATVQKKFTTVMNNLVDQAKCLFNSGLA
ncbi:glycosyltransferase family 1 protein [Polynucleobacter sp. MWH-Braz-FAM2G]|uniref:glycosyltransferase family 4 protein n=1 Tax=Polynucleobacter sp. MWH-Braz-FAM2G TaxID=1855883 RepID=UPI001BFDE92D|nr:glycosyltransferase family 1 protein [Polynucleobacter sp. MWH-Braz-FAM2G]QWD91077.1 glycosyltransferase family 4 protein [Polynucleobacter sp. MWH-Braz-FAM2G]